MSSSSESSLVELPLPYDISSAVSRALRIDSTATVRATENSLPGRSSRSLSYPTGYYDFPAHGSTTASAYSVSSDGENYAAGYYCPTVSNPYYYHHHHHSLSSGAIAAPEPQPYLYPHHYSAIHPADSHVQMEIEAWSETTTMSICNSSTDLLESKVNMEQLDRFCKYIDSSGDEEFGMGKDESNSCMLASAKTEYGCYVTRSLRSVMTASPPKKKQRKSTCVMSLSSYYDDDLDDVDELRNWKVELENGNMWREFDNVGTEMVITKAGRRMFPTLSLKVCGLDPKETYSVKLDILPADNRRYKYLQTEWVAVGRSDKKQIYCEYEHPDSPNSGSYWMDKMIAFKMVKLTNNKNANCTDQIILNSMHKYLPCMKITCENDGYAQSFSFPETTFIAVTAYQSTGVTQLKINNNPYARAFRESLPSSGSQKGGGHCSRHSSNRTNSLSPSQQTTGNKSQLTTPASSPKQTRSKQKTNCNSSVSVESGFESDTTADKRKDSTSLIMPQSNPFNSPSLMTYCWGDDNSLWNPDIITPDPLMETANSFTAYLDTTSIETECEIRDSDDNNSSSSTKKMLEILPEPDIELANVEAAIQVDDDVFF